jgi:hypothetical protein
MACSSRGWQEEKREGPCDTYGILQYFGVLCTNYLVVLSFAIARTTGGKARRALRRLELNTVSLAREYVERERETEK